MLERLLILSFTSYAITFVIASSRIMEPIREKVKKVFSNGRSVNLTDNRHFIECRMCVGFWVSLVVCGSNIHEWQFILPVYGISYFLATQEL
jgi:hypothetical protein